MVILLSTLAMLIPGYGTSQSMLEVTASKADEGTVYKCYVDVPGGDAYHMKELPLKFCKLSNKILIKSYKLNTGITLFCEGQRGRFLNYLFT